MFLIDDLLLFPARGILAAFREIHNAAQQEVANEAEAIRTQLSDLYMMLETGGITEDEFERQEKELLDRLDAIEAGGTEDEEQDESADEDGLQEQPEKELLDRLDEIEAAGTENQEQGESENEDGLQDRSNGATGGTQEQALVSRAP